MISDQLITAFRNFEKVNVQRCIEGFHHQLESWSIAEWTNATAGEAGEACNVAKKLLRYRDGIAGNKVSKEFLQEQLADELADMIVYCSLTAASQGIDLGEAIKRVFNRKSEEISCSIII